MLELYHDWDSLMSFKVRVCLAEKGLQWTSRLIKLTRFEHLNKQYLKLNPNGVVPTLVHDGEPIIESSVINEYLDDVFPTPTLRPSDLLERSRVRSWIKYGDDVLHYCVRPATFELMIKPRLKLYTSTELEELIASHPQPDRADAYRKAAAAEIDYDSIGHTARVAEEAFTRIEFCLKTTKWLATDTFSLADVMSMPFVDRIEHLGFDFLINRRPSVLDWVERLKARDSYQSSMPPPEDRLPSPSPDAVSRLVELFK